jgi:hypothetical protein
MFLHIHDQLTLGELQDRFADCFPFLKLEFYAVGHKRFEPTDKEHLLNAWQRVGEVRKTYQNGALEIKSWYTVARVEKDLKEQYGLNAQVFRSNAKGEWVQTSVSDLLTLEEQSAFGYDKKLNQ